MKWWSFNRSRYVWVGLVMLLTASCPAVAFAEDIAGLVEVGEYEAAIEIIEKSGAEDSRSSFYAGRAYEAKNRCAEARISYLRGARGEGLFASMARTALGKLADRCPVDQAAASLGTAPERTPPLMPTLKNAQTRRCFRVVEPPTLGERLGVGLASTLGLGVAGGATGFLVTAAFFAPTWGPYAVLPALVGGIAGLVTGGIGGALLARSHVRARRARASRCGS